ncbi:fumarate reductase/succinate dehydrogenase flavoprotein domain protein (plasmid) [Haloterrigena turkmenica DSM 5511]|uniref:Fumarate reductase/succinate dehydrogenase flavoprotein domain protein n=1 Tax=Haloterrigena turkmenica (strain ATCC 51198 / DSM 5511 / JCM 9101 / NCIMB 13204 / VKM B-1734 / 4k) TaxID=543526 RepID=D2RZY1_HALTV|nr:FAD-binding protein [Haloterrigena turkmenica]ADB62678.1 fumarate reductase/succinate dehydrogenase flavoprotein domain protein [Haloterrigena turkmenica DSM 5511]
MVANSPEEWDREADVVIVGSGGAGLVAALAAESEDILVLEKAASIGGTTAVSGGGLWLPNSRPVLEEAGEQPAEQIHAYIRRCAGERVDDELIETFVELAPDVVDFVESETALEFQFAGYPDYHTDWEEASDEGNMIEPTLYDGTRLGENLDDIRDDPHHTFPVPASEIYEAGGHAKFATVADFDELERRNEADLLATGEALVAGLYEACLDAGVAFETEAPARELVVDDGEVVGVVAAVDEEETFVRAGAVVIAAGGMDWDEDMRENFLRGPVTGPATPPQVEGDGIKLGMDVGADLGNTNEAWWFPTAHVPGQRWEDGSPLYSMVWGRTLPGSIMVNEDGERFCNEAGNYHDLGKRFHTFDPETYEYENLPAYLVVDSGYREQYSLLTVAPGEEAPDWVAEGETLRDLAVELDVDPDGLEATVEAFNEHAREGVDPAFGRGETAYDNFVGDPDTDHPNLAPLNEPPFYAVEVHSGIIGTKGGLITRSDGTVLDVDADPIDGLYAASNSTAHVMGMGYAGAGATLGPNVVFGYQAGKHASEFAD